MKKIKPPVFLIIFIAFVIVGLGIVRITLVNSISTTGIELANLQNELQVYKKLNAILEEKYLNLASLTTIDSKAKTLGFVATKSQIYLSTPLPLALQQ